MDELRDYIKAHLHWGPIEGVDRVRFMTLALCGEAGELANLVKKDWRGDDGNRREKMIEELADCANYVFMLAEVLGVNLPVEMLVKLKAVEQREAWRRRIIEDPMIL